ncbi:TPA: ATP-binding cassette domain-containing protein, partial [Streptococcus pneumoniae]
MVGQVGRNGVGKSTLMKILVQNNQPTSGNIISSDNVGYLIEEPKLFLSKTGLENL